MQWDRYNVRYKTEMQHQQRRMTNNRKEEENVSNAVPLRFLFGCVLGTLKVFAADLEDCEAGRE